MIDWKHSKRWNYWTEHGFGVEVCQHNEHEPRDYWDFPCNWNTYLYFCDKVHYSRDGKLCEPYAEADPRVDYLWKNRDALNRLEGWNGGPTFHEFVTDERGVRRIKIGDDFQHLWDGEDQRYKMYDLQYMQRQVLRTAAEAADLLRFLMRPEQSGQEGKADES